MVIEQAAHIIAGARTGAQQVHSDATHLTTYGRSRSAEFVVKPDAPTAAALAALAAQTEAGGATYSLNVQLPLQSVTMENGPRRSSRVRHPAERAHVRRARASAARLSWAVEGGR